MHFVTGGACQGKRKWVRQFYQLDQERLVHWQSAYDSKLKVPQSDKPDEILVLEGIEAALKQSVQAGEDNIRGYWREFFESCLRWEQHNRKCIIIGVDISKGIVPIDQLDRQWRDETGWCYQDVAAMSDRVDVIWCGLNQTLKH